MPGISAVAADERTAGFFATGGDAGDDGRADLGFELAAGEVIEEEQWFRTLHHKVVDRHGDEVNADGVVPARFDRDLDLGADAVGARDQDGIGKARPLEVEQAAESADFGVGARPCGGAHQRR
jgi:hypothetical protein